jgi:hypothetical protein
VIVDHTIAFDLDSEEIITFEQTLIDHQPAFNIFNRQDGRPGGNATHDWYRLSYCLARELAFPGQLHASGFKRRSFDESFALQCAQVIVRGARVNVELLANVADTRWDTVFLDIGFDKLKNLLLPIS